MGPTLKFMKQVPLETGTAQPGRLRQVWSECFSREGQQGPGSRGVCGLGCTGQASQKWIPLRNTKIPRRDYTGHVGGSANGLIRLQR